MAVGVRRSVISNVSGSTPSRAASLLAAFDSLKADPYQRPDFDIEDISGRQLSIRAFRPFLITYWLDASVKEVRVVDIE